MSDWLADWEVNERRRWAAQYGPAPRYLPRKQENGTYSRGIGHTGSPWPRGRGHDWCWAPFDCISCGCSWNGPCQSHANIARIDGWDGTRASAKEPTDA